MIAGTAHKLICGDVYRTLNGMFYVNAPSVAMAFADPPDNIGLGYNNHNDSQNELEYLSFLDRTIWALRSMANIVWLSFNPKWMLPVAGMFNDRRQCEDELLEFKPCVQTFTFGQHNKHDLGVGHRPLWRLKRKDAPLYPETIKVESWRQQHGDKRANPNGRVPCDVFDFPRVTGNSKQRRGWHPTQLHEGLVERCVLLSTKPGDTVIDAFSGTGTTLRVCKRLGRNTISIEMDPVYCQKIAEEHDLHVEEL